jgi:hypothetical protein
MFNAPAFPNAHIGAVYIQDGPAPRRTPADTPPTPAEEQAHLRRLIARVTDQAGFYAPLGGRAQATDPVRRRMARMRGARLCYQPRRAMLGEDDASLDARRPTQPQTQTQALEFNDVLDAFAGHAATAPPQHGPDDAPAPRAPGPKPILQAAVLGAPGAGKSTTLSRLALDLARCGEPDAPIPVLVDLAAWTHELRAPDGSPLSAPTPADYAADLARFLAESRWGLGQALAHLAAQDRLVLLLDALNQVPTHQRKGKAAAVRDLIAQLNAWHPRACCPVYVSCRTDDYQRGDLDLGLDTLELQPLTPPRVREVLRHWWQPEPDDPMPADPDGWQPLFWRLAGHPDMAAVEKAWLAAGGDPELIWTLKDPNDDHWDP